MLPVTKSTTMPAPSLKAMTLPFAFVSPPMTVPKAIVGMDPTLFARPLVPSAFVPMRLPRITRAAPAPVTAIPAFSLPEMRSSICARGPPDAPVREELDAVVVGDRGRARGIRADEVAGDDGVATEQD